MENQKNNNRFINFDKSILVGIMTVLLTFIIATIGFGYQFQGRISYLESQIIGIDNLKKELQTINENLTGVRDSVNQIKGVLKISEIKTE